MEFDATFIIAFMKKLGLQQFAVKPLNYVCNSAVACADVDIIFCTMK